MKLFCNNINNKIKNKKYKNDEYEYDMILYPIKEEVIIDIKDNYIL